MADLHYDQNFIPVEITGPDGTKGNAFWYKPQDILCLQYMSVEFAKQVLGYKITETRGGQQV